MIKVEVKFEGRIIVDLPVESFNDISEKYMSINESDEIIKDAIDVATNGRIWRIEDVRVKEVARERE